MNQTSSQSFYQCGEWCMEDSFCKAASYFPNTTCQLFHQMSGLIQSPAIVTQIKNCTASPPIMTTSSNTSAMSGCMFSNMTVDGLVTVIYFMKVQFYNVTYPENNLKHVSSGLFLLL